MTTAALKKSINQKTGCIAKALAILGDKWSPLLIKELTTCPQTFSELEKILVGISPRTLSQRLNKLVDEDIVVKSLYCERPPRYSYSLTTKGSDLQVILQDMAKWSSKYKSDRC
ncbi:MAG: helix-turn-helix transcriptional regulator [Patescibacteria group bacterium]|jgi:DNA-binding HxlR family transcriptional regulator|nr:helix-turn-helix transcriptional regulator [Patescibacteria group bacterium]